jgi:hypothetical protein
MTSPSVQISTRAPGHHHVGRRKPPKCPECPRRLGLWHWDALAPFWAIKRRNGKSEGALHAAE